MKKKTKETDLFDTAQSVVPSDWSMVFEQRNLLYMLAAGLIMSPRGLGDKYYQDSLASSPGWLPLFNGGVPAGALEQASSEGRSSRPVIAKIDIEQLQGKVYALNSGSELREIDFPKGLEPDNKVILIPAPLPVTWITKLEFENKEDELQWKENLKNYGNVSGDSLKTCVGKTTKKSKVPPWPVDAINLVDRDLSPDIPLAYGGCLGVFSQLVSRSQAGVHIASYAFGEAKNLPEEVDDIFKPLVRNRFAECSADGTSEYLWEPVQAVAMVRSSPASQNHVDTLLDSLGELAEKSEAKHAKGLLSKLASELREVKGFSDLTISEIFKRYPKRISRAMMLFVLRDSVPDLLEFQHSSLSQQDYLAAGILFGARDGWIGLPAELKATPSLNKVICHKMAEMAQEMSSSGISLGESPKREITTWEALVLENRPWKKELQKEALGFASRKKWNECIQTIVKLKPGDYNMSSTPRNVVIKFQGKLDFSEELEEDRFLDNFLELATSDRDDKKLRSAIG